MEVTDALVNRLAALAKLSFNAQEREAMKADLKRMLALVERLSEVNVDGIRPLIHVNEVANVMRADEVSEQLAQQAALQNAPLHDNFYFKVPKVVQNTEE